MEGNFSNCKEKKRERDELSRGGRTSSRRALCRRGGKGEFSSPPPGVGWRDLRWVLPRLGGLFRVQRGRWGGVPSIGGTASGMMLQATVEVPIAWARGNENELLGLEGTDQFVRFANRTVGSNSSISIRLLPDPIGPTGPTDPVRFLKPWWK